MKINLRKIIVNLCCFYILFYVFNISVISRILPSYEISTFLLVLSVVTLLFLGSIKRINKIQFITILITIIVLIFELNSNYYIKEGQSGNVVKFTLMLFLPFIIITNRFCLNSLFSIMNVFCAEHIIATFFAQFFKGFYQNTILPWIANGTHIMAMDNFADGYNPGFTTHYSMNGMYLSFSTIYLFSKFLKNKESKYIIFTLFSIVALLFTAKRGHLIFTLISCIVLYFISNRERLPKKVIKFSFILLSALLIVLILSMFIPQILNVVTRIEDGIKEGNLLNGRQDFYDLTISMWKDHKILGNGWGAFSYNFQLYLYDENYGVEYLDAHNVYLQLLAECGIIGLLFFLGIMIYIYIFTFNLIKSKKYNLNDATLNFSMGYQTFFLLYCFTGNPLYDMQCYCIYFICIGITIKKYLDLKRNEVKNERKINNTYSNL